MMIGSCVGDEAVLLGPWQTALSTET